MSRYGVLDLAPTLDHVGPMARSVRDAARVLGVIAGHDPNDPTSLANPVPDLESEMERGAQGLRVGWDAAYATADVEPHVAKAVHAAIEQLAKLGAEIVEVNVPTLSESDGNAWFVLTAVEAAAVHAATFPSRAAEYGAYFRQFLEDGNATTGVQYAMANFTRREVAGRFAPLFHDVDILASPTLASESFRYTPDEAYGSLDAERHTLAGAPVAFFSRSNRFVPVWDGNGYPTLSLPCGLSPDGMPLSLQLVAAPLGEAVLCRAGYAYEQAEAHHLQHPPLDG